MEKRIGIITIINVNNYGAELQAFALYYSLKLMGYDSEIINYLYYKNTRYISERRSAPLFKGSKLNRLKDFLLKCIDNYSKLRHPKIARFRLDRFNNFHAQYTQLSKEFRSFSELYNFNHAYHTYIVGSDQVWNPNNLTSIEPYFLSFAPKEAKKISYASSFGVEKIDRAYYDTYRKLINNIDFISTREVDGVNIIKDITGKDATHVVDPTLLLSKKEWEEILTPFEFGTPYILLFVFRNSKYLTDLAMKLQNQTGYKIIRICKNEMNVESDGLILNMRDKGPLEFLGLYQRAAIVLTTSFHGTIFSLIFEKPFYTIVPANKNNNSRQQSVLRLLGLEDRLIKEGREISLENLFSIDYNKVKPILDKEIEKSKAFLLYSLNSK